MTAATGVGRQAHDYLAAVELQLADLPADDRSALLEDLALHLDALTTEDDDRPVVVRLGPPAEYAADLRAAAGLPPRRAAGTAVAWRDRLDAVLGSAVVRRAVPAGREARRLLGELRPAWWVLRGYLAVLVPCLLGADYVEDVPVPAPMHSHLLGVLLVLGAVAASVFLGRRALPRPLGVLVVAAGLVLLLGSAVVGDRVWHDVRLNNAIAADAIYAPPPDHGLGGYPLVSRHGPVTDVFPYAADGTPLEGVLLYDQDGRPLQVGFQEWWADNCVRVLSQPRAADGVPVPQSFPQNYELLGLDVDIHPAPASAGQCLTEVPRPAVPLPVFPPAAAAESPAPAPGG